MTCIYADYVKRLYVKRALRHMHKHTITMSTMTMSTERYIACINTQFQHSLKRESCNHPMFPSSIASGPVNFLIAMFFLAKLFLVH